MIKRLHRALDAVVLAVTVPLAVVMLVCVVWQVIARYLLGVSTSFTDELARFLFIWVSMLGSALVLGRRGHIAITGLVDLAPAAIRRMLLVGGHLLILLFAAVVLGYGGFVLVERAQSLGQISPAIQMPMSWVYVVIPLSGLLTLLYGLIVMAGMVAGEATDERQVNLD